MGGRGEPLLAGFQRLAVLAEGVQQVRDGVAERGAGAVLLHGEVRHDRHLAAGRGRLDEQVGGELPGALPERLRGDDVEVAARVVALCERRRSGVQPEGERLYRHLARSCGRHNLPSAPHPPDGERRP